MTCHVLIRNKTFYVRNKWGMFIALLVFFWVTHNLISWTSLKRLLLKYLWEDATFKVVIFWYTSRSKISLVLISRQDPTNQLYYKRKLNVKYMIIH